MAAIRPCTGTTADWKAVEDTLILKEREIGVELDASGHYQIRQGDGKKKFLTCRLSSTMPVMRKY